MSDGSLIDSQTSAIIKALAQKEIDLCENQEQLLAVKKRWDKYFAGLNKFMAGKGTMPYFDEKGNVCHE